MRPRTDIPVDPASHVPVYRQIEELLKKEIKTGDLQPFAKVWSERIISEQFNVSRMTVRKALANLIHGGYLFTQKGKGTFVSDSKINQPVLKLRSFFEEMKDLGLEPSSKILSHKEIKADDQIAAELGVREGTMIFKIRRLMLANGIPYSIETKCIIMEKCNMLKKWSGKDDEILEILSGQCHQCVTKYDIYIEAMTLSKSEANLFGLKEGKGSFCIKRYAHDRHEKLSFVKSIYRGDLYRFHLTAEY